MQGLKQFLYNTFGVVPKVFCEQLEKENKQLSDEVILLKAKKIELESKIIPKPIISVDLADPEPVDYEKRKLYVATMAGMHKDYLSPKLKKIIANLRSEFEKVDRNCFGLTQEEYDWFLKGSINMAWILHDWGDSMINEQIAYQRGISEDELSELKSNLNN